MTDKDINIHVRAKDTEQTKRDVDGVANSTEKLGDKTQQAAGKASGLGGVLSGLATKAVSFIGAWKAVDLIIDGLDKWIARLKKIRDLQKEVHNQARSLHEVGQSLEIQTGTVGKQGEWADYAVQLQKQGALGSVAEAERMAISFDIATQKTGGLSNQANKDLLMRLSPMFGTADLSGDEIKKFLEFASTAGVEQTEQGYKEFFAKLLAGYRASKSDDFGVYLTGLQSGTTGMIAQGGSAEGAMSLFTAARAVMKDEATAATLAEQVGRMSSGAYEKPRRALEKFSGKSWETMTPDQQLEILLNYTQSIPQSQRVQRLTGQGFAPELATGLAKMASEESMQVLQRSRNAIQDADTTLLDRQIESYKQSLPGRAREREGKRAEGVLELEKEIGSFQERLEDAKLKVDEMAAKGEDDPWTKDEYEAYIVAYREMVDEIEALQKKLEAVGTPEADALGERALKLKHDLYESSGRLYGLPGVGNMENVPFLKARPEGAARKGLEYHQELSELLEQSQELERSQGVVINYNITHDMSVHHNIRPPKATMRVSPGDL